MKNKIQEQERIKTESTVNDLDTRKLLANDPIIFRIKINILNGILILINLGVSNHYFTNNLLFVLYILCELSKIGLLANKDSMFVIVRSVTTQRS